ncbi:MAG: sacsin N-terminal ATP-binding-like domain-containing protein [Bacteroidales bacterium]
MNKTPEQMELDEKDRRTNLKKFCDSILQKIRALDNNSGDRAIWELCQNARDLSSNATIRITLDKDYFTFAHKGEPFNEDSLLSLVKQVSSEGKENEEAAGQFGTGFVTTHAFSRNFNLYGSFHTITNKVFDIDRFEIDRNEDDINNFIDKMDLQIKAVYNLLNTPESETREWTKLEYPLNQHSQEIAIKAIRVSERMLPYVLVLNDKIMEVTLENKIDNKTVIFSKGKQYKENDLNVLKINISTPEGIESTKCVYYLEDGDTKIILPLNESNKAIKSDSISKIFVWFPLLGTEQWGTNFVYHSTFYPLETRNGIVLPCDNINVEAQFKHNVNMLHKMNTLLHNYLKNHVGDIKNAIELAKINFNCNVEDKITKEFFKSEQELWTRIFRKLPLIDTPKGRKCLDDDVKILNLNICDFFANEDNKDKYFDSFYDYASLAATLPNKDICLRWSSIIHEWGLSDESLHEINLAEIAQQVTADSDYKKLHNLLEIIKECNHIKLFETMQLIPNREGELKDTANLRNGINITEDLYKRVLAISPLEMKKLVHVDFADIYNLNEYTRDHIRQAVFNVNENKKTSTIRAKRCFDHEYTTSLRNFVSIYTTENPSSNRHLAMQSLSALQGFDYKICHIPKVDENETDYCQSAFIFLLESELLDISIKSKTQTDWLNENKPKLLDLISKVSAIKETDYSSRLLGSNGYEVIPNQSGTLCKLETLRIRDNEILDELANLYYDVIKNDLRDTWVDDDFSKFVSAEKQDYAKNIAFDIESSLLDDYEKSGHISPQIIDIIQKIESKTDASLWGDWFKRIDKDKADLNWHIVPEESKSSFYRLMKVAHNKSLLEDLAEISENASVLIKFKDFLQKHKQEEAEFEFKYKLGKHIEDMVRIKLREELNQKISFLPSIKDQQCGQDIVVIFEEKEIFYIECKAKWNFNEPAHMSKLQIQKAFNERDKYALCAVDLSEFNHLNKDCFPDMEELINNIHIHLNIADEIGDNVKPLLEMREDILDDKMTISAQYQSNIPKKVFVNNIGFDMLLDAIIKQIKHVASLSEKMEEME